MPHYKCVTCRTRLRVSQPPADSADSAAALCPQCGMPLEPVGDLAEVVGFRAIASGADHSIRPFAAPAAALALPRPGRQR